MSENSASYSEIGSNCPSAGAQPAGQKLEPTHRISPINGSSPKAGTEIAPAAALTAAAINNLRQVNLVVMTDPPLLPGSVP
jgi:hypothetical protein